MTKLSGVGGYYWEYQESLAAAGNGNTLMIPAGITALAVTVLASGGATARLEATMDGVDEIIGNTETYIAWPDGEVTSETDMSLSPATRAIRIVQTGAGASTLKVRATI
jgi:hypothetical protein